jgi:hypothetical protein
MISSENGKEKTVVVRIFLSPKQAERLEKFKLLFNLPKSDIAEVALEDLFKNPQTTIIQKVRKRQ